MNFITVLGSLIKELDQQGIRYALIGGFAMAMRGVQRATMDLDLILALDDLEGAHSLLLQYGYERAFYSENVSHYQSQDPEWGRIDILHAFRAPSLKMLDRAERLELTADIALKVARIEDIIGLKIQAMSNDLRRAEQDWLDCRQLSRLAWQEGISLDWDLLESYFSLFDKTDLLPILRSYYGPNE